MNRASRSYLPPGLPVPTPEADGLSKPFWDGLQAERLRVQRCAACATWQFGPEWICHACHAFDPAWVDVEPRGLVHSWERVWHPSHPALKNHGPYLVVLVELIELASAGGVRMLGNLLGDLAQEVTIGMPVEGVFEHRTEPTRYSLLQWQPIK